MSPKFNLAETFKLFKQRIELYFLAKHIEIADQVVHILLQVGDEGLRRYNYWTMSEEDNIDPKKIFAAFEEQLEPPENYRISRLKLTQYRQTQEESLGDFTNICKLQTLKCDFVDDELNERLSELIISSTPIVDFQKELLNKPKGMKLHDTSIPRRNEAYATLRIQLRNRPGLHNFTLKVDTGAQANTMPFRTFRDMFPEQLDRFGNPCTDCLQPTESILTAYNGTGVACSGTVDINCSYDGREWRNTKFFVVDVPGAAILGLSTCEA